MTVLYVSVQNLDRMVCIVRENSNQGSSWKMAPQGGLCWKNCVRRPFWKPTEGSLVMTSIPSTSKKLLQPFGRWLFEMISFSNLFKTKNNKFCRDYYPQSDPQMIATFGRKLKICWSPFGWFREPQWHPHVYSMNCFFGVFLVFSHDGSPNGLTKTQSAFASQLKKLTSVLVPLVAYFYINFTYITTRIIWSKLYPKSVGSNKTCWNPPQTC